MIASFTRINKKPRVPVSAQETMQNDNLPLATVFTADCIETLQSWTSKAEVIRTLVQSLVNHNRLGRRQAENILPQLIQHESYGSSAIGKGLAFPHLRTHEVQSFMGAIGVAPNGIRFDALDGKPTRLVFLLLSPLACRDQHMNLLSRLVRLMKDQVACIQLHHLLQHEDIYQYLRDLDEHSDASVKSPISILGNETDD